MISNPGWIFESNLATDFFNKDGYLHCVVTGDYDLREMIKDFAHIIVSCRRTGQTRVLYDFRQRKGSGSAVERILYAEESLILYIKHLNLSGVALRIAYLGGTDTITNYTPAIDIAKQQNFDAIFTSDLEQALAYLWE